MLSHRNLKSFYLVTFSMIQHHNWSLSEIESLMPWEFDIYVGLLNQYITEENEKRAKEK